MCRGLHSSYHEDVVKEEQNTSCELDQQFNLLTVCLGKVLPSYDCSGLPPHDCSGLPYHDCSVLPSHGCYVWLQCTYISAKTGTL